MFKLVATWFVMYAINVLLSSVWGGGGGLLATTLTSALSATQTSAINVDSTQGYLSEDTLYIENEQIHYTGKTSNTFTGLTRAYNRTKAAAHTAIGTPVYSQEMGLMNQAAGFTISEVETTGGTAAAPGFNPVTLIKAIPQVVWWNYPFLGGQLIYLRIVLIMLGVAFTATIVVSGISSFTSIIRGR